MFPEGIILPRLRATRSPRGQGCDDSPRAGQGRVVFDRHRGAAVRGELNRFQTGGMGLAEEPDAALEVPRKVGDNARGGEPDFGATEAVRATYSKSEWV